MSFPDKKITYGEKTIASSGNDKFGIRINWFVFSMDKKFASISFDASANDTITNDDEINKLYDEYIRYGNEHFQNSKKFSASFGTYSHLYVLKEDYKYWLNRILKVISDPHIWNNHSITSTPDYWSIISERKWMKDWFKRISDKSWHRYKMAEYKSLNNIPANGNQLLYFIACPELKVIKIGISYEPKKRLASLQTAFPFPLEIIKIINQSQHTEYHLHDKFSKYRKTGEWFEFTDEIQTFINHL